MSILLIARALEKRLSTLTPKLDVAPENGTYQPKTGVPYMATNMLFAPTLTRDLKETQHEERGIFQVTVCYPSGTGAVQARAHAEAVRTHFQAGLRLVEQDVTVEVLGKPNANPAIPADGWYCVPVSVTYKVIIQPVAQP